MAGKAVYHKHTFGYCCFSLFILTIVSICAVTVMSICIRVLGPESRLSSNVVIDSNVQLLSRFPQFCTKVEAQPSDSSNTSARVTLFLEGNLEENAQENCTINLEFEISCTVDIPLTPNTRLYAEVEYGGLSEHLQLSLTCIQPRFWLYAVFSLVGFFLVEVCGILCILVVVCLLCKRNAEPEPSAHFIYTPLLTPSSSHSVNKGEQDHSFVKQSPIPKTDVQSTEDSGGLSLSSSYKFSSFKPGTREGRSKLKKRLAGDEEKILPHSGVKKSFDDASGTYTFNTFKP